MTFNQARDICETHVESDGWLPIYKFLEHLETVCGHCGDVWHRHAGAKCLFGPTSYRFAKTAKDRFQVALESPTHAMGNDPIWQEEL